MITRQDIAMHLERQVRVGFVAGASQYTSLRGAFAREVPSSAAFESYADMGAPPWPVNNAGKQGPGGSDERTDAAIVGQMNSGGAVTVFGANEKSLIVYNVDWDITAAIDHNAIDDDQTGDLEAWARSASVNFERHKDYQCFNALNAGEANTTYGNGYDKLPLFSNSHLDPGAEYQTAQDNLNSLVLSLDNFETIKVAASKFKDGRGQPVGYNHNLLIVPPDLERIAAQITTNRDAYDTANREINPYSGSVRALVAPGGWIDTSAWFVVDPTQIAKPINLQLRKNPELTIWDDETQGAGVRYYKWHARYNVFYGDWRQVVQGNS